MTCRGCGTENKPGRRFCGQCGVPLQRSCPACGAENDAVDRFCGGCGAALVEGVTAPAASATAVAQLSERRLVSVLFADLVGFTALSEHRDPEEVRGLLSQYFERCRTLISRYGGTVEKFIGDAVMAVWGSPIAREDDAERAVRAALSLTHAVIALGEELGMPELRLRAGVLTGSAAVDLGMEMEGMVLGDTVNTASRLQTLAAPGMVLVDEVTRRASEVAIAYEDAGIHQVKGREQPVQAWTALRVVAGAGGARRSVGIEAPFVGRDRELQTIIEAGERSATEETATRVTVAGEAGTGKSRLVWEFFKYLDGIQDVRWWHQGRCLSYGEGVAYWALAEMVRSRAGILEEDSPSVAREKLTASVAEHVPDERDRRLVEPRLAHLLRLEERPDADRADLFSGWRLFFERLARTHPVILVFEDLQWADGGLLDFIDYLLDWSADFPLFIVALGRPEMLERRSASQPLRLEPLSDEAIVTILEGLVPGLPETLVRQVVRRADGIPLYAVETIRMLRDKGILVPAGDRYVLTSEITDLEVPETLQALVASRLDGLTADERSLVQDASVLGQAFTTASAAALGGLPESEVKAILDRLVSKQVLARDDDPRSPERGQYVFLQALLRTVAYGTLSRRGRKERHIAAARHLRQSWPGEARDVAEVLASHYQEAIRAEPDAPDAPRLRAAARETLTAAGRAAASLALGPEAQRYFEQAAELTEDELERAGLIEQSGQAMLRSGDLGQAENQLRQALELYGRLGKPVNGAVPALAGLLRYRGDLDEARTVLEPALAAPSSDANRVLRAEALAEQGALLVWGGSPQMASEPLEEALTILEMEQAWAPLANALIHRAVQLVYSSRREECLGVLTRALALAEIHDLSATALRARMNLAQVSIETDRFTQALDQLDEALAVARERGDRMWERQILSQRLAPQLVLGMWDDAEPVAVSLVSGELDLDAVTASIWVAKIGSARGDDIAVNRCLALTAPRLDSTYLDQQVAASLAHARAALERGQARDALRMSVAIWKVGAGVAGEFVEEAYEIGVDAAIRLGDRSAMDELLGFVAGLPPARATPLLRAGHARLAAEDAHLSGDSEATVRSEDEALELFRSVGARPQLAGALLDRVRRRDDPEALEEARSIYADLGAERWLAALEPRGQAVS